MIPGAPANIALELCANLLFGRIWNSADDVQSLQDHAGRAISALERVIVGEGLLHGMQPAALRDPLDRKNLLLVTLDGKDRARFYRLPVQVHRAGAALPGVPAEVGAGEMQSVAEKMRQQRSRFHLALHPAAVDLYRDRARLHCTLTFSSCPRKRASKATSEVSRPWIPVCAGMTERRSSLVPD